MHTLNLFIIPLILISFFFKIRFAYLISLLLSIATATFIFAEVGLLNILFTIIIFNLTPLVCQIFNSKLKEERLSLEAEREAKKSIYERSLKERTLIEQSNRQLSQQALQIAELYRMTRDMSSVLKFEEIFAILGRKLMQSFRFNRCRMILIDEEERGLKIKRVWQFLYAQPYVRQAEIETADAKILELSLAAQKISYIEKVLQVFAPLTADSKFLGAISCEGLAVDAGENFSILANQFSLEFKRIRLYQKIQALAITDGLTGLFVRRYFIQRLEEEMNRSTRHKLKLGFLMVDIDHFKQCNDRFGHLTGDAVLREVSRRIRANVREIDLVARFGGEEFCVLLPDTDKFGAQEVAERICASIDSRRFSAYDESLKIQVSIGVACFPQDADTACALIDKADQALYRAKQGGRNRVEIF